jgi:hypothetical protein
VTRLARPVKTIPSPLPTTSLSRMGDAAGCEDADVGVRRDDWDCRATVRHLASDFVGYAGQLTAPKDQQVRAL